jgi:hypothetical protein
MVPQDAVDAIAEPKPGEVVLEMNIGGARQERLSQEPVRRAHRRGVGLEDRFFVDVERHYARRYEANALDGMVIVGSDAERLGLPRVERLPRGLADHRVVLGARPRTCPGLHEPLLQSGR